MTPNETAAILLRTSLLTNCFDELAEQVESEQERNDERRQLAESLRDLPADEARAVLKAVRGGA